MSKTRHATGPAARAPTVFLSYSSRDKRLAGRIADDLEKQGIKVWFAEREICVGDSVPGKISDGLRITDFIAVLLTKRSVNSGWVEKEWHTRIDAEVKARAVSILPLRGDECTVPELLREKKYADFVGSYENGLVDLLRAIAIHSGFEPPALRMKERTAPERSSELPIGGIRVPCFFPSVSGAAKSPLTPRQNLEIVVALKHPLFLVSAYDIASIERREEQLETQQLIEEATENSIILLDSGLYEKKWLRSKNWTKAKYHEALRHTACHVAFAYDSLAVQGTASDVASTIAKGVIMDRKKGRLTAVAPIVHAHSPGDFPNTCIRLVDALGPAPVLVGIPERELGEGIIAAAETVYSIRQALNRSDQYHFLHILGCGNPLSILIYSALGADSFDGLDWCQTVVDHSKGYLHHTMHLDFFARQTRYASQSDLPYFTRVYAHNLVFYDKWMNKIQYSLKKGTIKQMMRKFLPSEIAEHLDRLMSS
jgi:queuine/archaeosine tRNA-ribosyltransferase